MGCLLIALIALGLRLGDGVGDNAAVPWGVMGATIGVCLDVMTYAGSAKPVRNSYQGAR
jgi:hypothetical protein